MSRPSVTRITAALLSRWPLPSLDGLEGKESRGRVLVVGGSLAVPGAVLLAGTAALRVGAGKLQLATARAAALTLGMHMPEAMVLGLPTSAAGELRAGSGALHDAVADTDALVVGPGMRSHPGAARLALQLADRTDAPVVLDAGALSACMSAKFRARRRGATVVTPHAGEMAALIGIDADAVAADAANVAARFAREWNVVTVLKGATTHIASPDGRCWVHTGGCLGLGTSGSGDVLAGALGGLLARGAEAERAAAWAVHLHGKAGLRLARRVGAVGFLAREIADELPQVLTH